MLMTVPAHAGINFAMSTQQPVYAIPEFSTEQEAIRWADNTTPLPHIRGQLIKRLNTAHAKLSEMVWNYETYSAGDFRIATARIEYTFIALKIIHRKLPNKYDFAMAIKGNGTTFHIPEFYTKDEALAWAMSLPKDIVIRDQITKQLLDRYKIVSKLYYTWPISNQVQLSTAMDRLIYLIAAAQLYESRFDKAMNGSVIHAYSIPI